MLYLEREGTESIVRVKDTLARDSRVCAGDDDPAPSGGCRSLNHLLYERRRLVRCCKLAIALWSVFDESMRPKSRRSQAHLLRDNISATGKESILLELACDVD